MATAGNMGWWGWVLARVGLRARPLGERGERYAARYLKKQGMRIVGRNRFWRGGEIDVIGVEGEWLVFVEVRTRTSEAFMTPEASIRYWKKKAVVRTVRGLVRKYRVKGLKPRVDVVGIVWPAGEREPREVRWHKFAMRVEGWV
jgi:putative endonuclease